MKQIYWCDGIFVGNLLVELIFDCLMREAGACFVSGNAIIKAIW